MIHYSNVHLMKAGEKVRGSALKGIEMRLLLHTQCLCGYLVACRSEILRSS